MTLVEQAETLEHCFNAFDVDGSGYLSRDELQHLMTTAGSNPLSDEECNEFLELADPDCTGES